MLRPVKLNSSGDPGTCKSHQRRLDNTVIIDKIIAVCLIQGSLYPASKFRHHHDFQIFILQEYNVPYFAFLFPADIGNRRIRVYLAAASLINPLFKEHRIDVRISDLVCWNLDFLFPYLYCVHAILP